MTSNSSVRWPAVGYAAGGGFGGLGGSMGTIPGYGRRAAAILHLRGLLRYRVIFKMRLTTTPSASTSKSSSSFHSPDGRLAEARLRINGSDASNPKWQMIQESQAIRMAMRLEKRKARILR
jgi:hypothetical protein